MFWIDGREQKNNSSEYKRLIIIITHTVELTHIRVRRLLLWPEIALLLAGRTRLGLALLAHDLLIAELVLPNPNVLARSFFFFFFLTKRVSDSRVATLLSPAAVAVATGRKD